MIGFLGEFEATLDAKGRFLLPAGFKKQLPEEETKRFVMNRGFEKCLALYPMKTWEPLFAKITGLNEFDPKQREFRRAFLNGATYVEPDSAGRILLPPNLKVYAELQKDIVLMATGDKIEIWDSNKYKQFFDSISSDALSDLGKDVMGGEKNEK
jgi:MraZ protein